MKKKTAGALLIGAGIGLAVAWILRGRILGPPKRVRLTLKGVNGGVELEPLDPEEEYVELSKGQAQTIQWVISNPEDTGYDGRVEVSIRNWHSEEAGETPPVLSAGNSRKVNRGGPDVPLTAVINPAAPPFPFGPNREGVSYKYDVYVNETRVLDPIVRLIL